MTTRSEPGCIHQALCLRMEIKGAKTALQAKQIARRLEALRNVDCEARDTHKRAQ